VSVVCLYLAIQNGTTSISYDQLYHWYNAQRITKTSWRDIQSRWEELLEEKSEESEDPQIVETASGITFFFIKDTINLSEKAS